MKRMPIICILLALGLVGGCSTDISDSSVNADPGSNGEPLIGTPDAGEPDGGDGMGEPVDGTGEPVDGMGEPVDGTGEPVDGAAEPGDSDGNTAGSDTGGDSQHGGSDTDSAAQPPPPALQDDTPAGELVASIRQLATTVLDELNDRLSSGVALSSTEQNCLGDFDPALGEALLAIECDTRLVLSSRRVLVMTLRLIETSACQESLRNANGRDCALATAAFEIPDRWVTPEVGRPQPVIGVTVDYRERDATRLILENTDAVLGGVFRCEFDLATGRPTDQSTPFTDCADEVERADTLLEDALDSFGTSGALLVAGS